MRIPFRKVIRHWPSAIDAAAMALDPRRSASYYPEVPRKTRVRTVVENITWAIRHGEVNGNYFAYGLDRVGVRPADYLGHRQAMSLIAARNRNVSGDPGAGGRTGMLRDKRAFAAVASRLGYPVPRIVGTVQKHRIALIDPPRTIAVQDLATQEGLVAFAKPVDGHHGRGAFLLAVRLGRVHLDDEPTAGQDLAARLSGPMLLQEPIVQHEATAHHRAGRGSMLAVRRGHPDRHGWRARRQLGHGRDRRPRGSRGLDADREGLLQRREERVVGDPSS
jgi:hypothetical protein